MKPKRAKKKRSPECSWPPLTFDETPRKDAFDNFTVAQLREQLANPRLFDGDLTNVSSVDIVPAQIRVIIS